MPGKVLVTGASGFIGSAVVERLVKDQFDVFALLRKTSSTKNLEGLPYERVEGSLGDLSSLESAVSQMDYVVHLAGATTARNEDEYFRHNSKGCENIAQALLKAKTELKRLVYVSSLAAGGPVQSYHLRKESDPDQPVSAYGRSKLDGEKKFLAHRDKIPTTIIRPPIVFGPKDKMVLTMIKPVAKGWMPLAQGQTESGHKYYSVIYRDDLVNAIAGAVTANVDSGSMFYVSHDQVVTQSEILATAAKALDVVPKRLKVPASGVKALAYGLDFLGRLTGRVFPLNRDKLAEITPDYWICSNQQAKLDLGFKAGVDLSSGLQKTIDWYRKHGWL